MELDVSQYVSSSTKLASYHPFSLQVHLQTQQVVSKGVIGMAVQVVKTQGVLALYNGLTASLGRQVGR